MFYQELTTDYSYIKIHQNFQNKNNPSIWGLKNTGSKTWVKHTPQGKEETVESGKVVPVARGLKIHFGNCEGEII